MVKIMMKDDSIVEFNGYSDIPAYYGYNLLFFKRYGSYQGDWVMFSEKDGDIHFRSGGYGSCSGCDRFEGHFDYEDDATQEVADSFVYAYKPQYIYKASDVTLETLVEYLHKNVDERNFDGDEDVEERPELKQDASVVLQKIKELTK